MRREPINLSRLAEYPIISVDVETTGLYWYKDELFGVAVAAFDDDVMYSGYWDIRKSPKVLQVLNEQLPKVKRLVNHNVKFDAHFLLNHGIRTPFDRTECTSVRAALLNEHEPSFSLDSLCKAYLNKGKRVDVYDRLAELFGGKADKSQMKNLHRAPVGVVSEYAVPDAELAIELWLHQEKHMSGLEQVWNLERELTSVLIDIERNGVLIDEEDVERKLRSIGPTKDKLVKKLLKIAGKDFNDKLFNSPKQMRELFKVCADEEGHWYAGPVKLVITDAGNPSIDADVLRLLSETHNDERADLILRVKKLDKAQQFLNNHIKGHLHDGRVFPNYNQTKTEKGTGTGTGRFSIDDPALQQIPARDVQMAEIVRSAFIPEKGEAWCCADWEQFEFRWFAHYVNDEQLNGTYLRNPDSDFHKTVADLTGLPRSPRFAGDANAKQINLGLVFGMGQGKLAAEMGLPYEIQYRRFKDGETKEVYIAGPEAEAVFEKYHSSIPGVKALLEQAGSIAKARGYVKTIMGRRLRFPGGKYTHKAGGLVFQGTSADCNKAKMIELYHSGHKQGDYRILLSVHDEFDFSLPKGNKKVPEIKRRLETFDGKECPIMCRIPIRSSVNVGPNWYEASK
jgi:DNA polymerase I-like protein with 3'-5' exonuclease and polymerase domains